MKNKATKTPTTTKKASAKEATAEKVLNLLIAKLEKGVNAWRKPWDCHGNPTVNPEFFPINLFTLKPYSGINSEILEPGFYAGFSQITANGGHVKKGAKAHTVVWFGQFEKDVKEQEQQAIWELFRDMGGKPSTGKYGACYRFHPDFYSTYNVYVNDQQELVKITKLGKSLVTEFVFNICDTTGLEKFVEKFEKTHKNDNKKPFNAIEAGELWISAYVQGSGLGGIFHDGGTKSYYDIMGDTIHVSKKTNYVSEAAYYSTVFHEMTHSSGAENRLNRDGVVKFDKFGSSRYAKEELIAEMGAAMAMGFLGIETESTEDNSAAYLGNWLQQKIGEKASEEALKTLMAASASAKFAFAYIAEFYEEAKARKEEENNKKKTEAPLTLLPAIIAPTSSSVPAVFKAEPFEACYRALPETGEAQIKMEEKTMKVYTIKLKSCAQFGDFSGGESIKEKTLSEEVNELNFTKHQLWQWLSNYEMQHKNGNERTEKWDKNLTIEEIVRIFQKSAYGITLEIEEKPCKKQPKATSKPWEDAKPLPFTQEQLDQALADKKKTKTYTIYLHDDEGAKYYSYGCEVNEIQISEYDQNFDDEVSEVYDWLERYAAKYGAALDREAERRIINNYTVEQIVDEFQDIVDGIELKIDDEDSTTCIEK